MRNYLLSDYTLSPWKIAQSLFVSEYGLKHLEEAKKNPERKWGHYLIAAIEFCPILGPLVSLIEKIVSKCLLSPPGPFVNEGWLFEGSQEKCKGSAPMAKVQAVFQRILKQKEKDITFNPTKITETLDGGTCSAMSLKFAELYLRIKKDFPSITTRAQRALFIKRLKDLGKEFANSSEEMRVRQAAFNTIEVAGSPTEFDASLQKMQSLANFHQLKIKAASKAVDTTKTTEEELSTTLSELSEGAHLVRIIKPALNEKWEEKGHTVVYIKEKNAEFFYDPNKGLKDLLGESHAPFLLSSFQGCFEEFQVSKASFYCLGKGQEKISFKM